MKRHIIRPSNLESCKYLEGVKAGSIRCTTKCEFNSNLQITTDEHGRMELIEFVCNHEEVKPLYKWNKIDSVTESFILEGEPERIHVIKTGFIDKYIVVYEDAYELNLGKIIFGTKVQIEKIFDIKLKI